MLCVCVYCTVTCRTKTFSDFLSCLSDLRGHPREFSQLEKHFPIILTQSNMQMFSRCNVSMLTLLISSNQEDGNVVSAGLLYFTCTCSVLKHTFEVLVFHFDVSILCNLILVLDSISEVNFVRLSGSLLDNFSLILTVKVNIRWNGQAPHSHIFAWISF